MLGRGKTARHENDRHVSPGGHLIKGLISGVCVLGVGAKKDDI